MLTRLKRLVDAQETVWMPPQRHGRTERERRVHRLWVEALLARTQSARMPRLRIWNGDPSET